MATRTMNIALPSAMRAYVTRRTKSGEYNNRSQYVCDLIRRHQHEQEIKRLQTLVAEGLEAGEVRVDRPPTGRSS